MANKGYNLSQTGFYQVLARYGQVLLIAMIVVVLALMIFPLHTALLDFLLAFNIVASLTILMVTLSISDPMKLSSFPTLLLLCALFRLGLNVSSTRLILSRGEAGDIIQTFGHFVTGGNMVVGVIIFLVLLIIQFLVVAKGSERVAEVAARFTLDALPGKQMSIDADLRAGLITSEQASQRRDELIKESRLYGSMDGAMKFVKGDTIAGFIITFINILAGLAIGVLQRGMEIGYATRVYTILTVGEGLVAQIPALVVSLSAGFIVTRVSDRENGTSLGGEIGRQIFVQPMAMFIVAGISMFLAFVPGFPTLLFLFLAVGLSLFAWHLVTRFKKDQSDTESIDFHRIEFLSAASDLGHAQPLVLEVGPEMYAKFLEDGRWRNCLNTLFPRIRTHLSNHLGVPLPDLKITVNEDLASERYAIKIYEVPVDEGFLAPEHLMVPQGQTQAADLKDSNGDESRTVNTCHGSPVVLLHLNRQQEIINKGIKAMAPEEVVLRHLVKVLKKHAAEFVGIQEVKDILSNVEKYHPELVREVVPRMLSVHKLTEVVKRLVEEGVPIKDFRVILETLSGAQPENKDTVDLSELVRMGLRRVLTYRYTGMTQRLNCFGLDPEIETEIAAHIKKADGQCYLTLAPEKLAAITRAVRMAYQNHSVNPRQAVILTSVEVRRYVRKIIESELPDVSVLSYQELDPGVSIDQRDTISLNYPELVAV